MRNRSMLLISVIALVAVAVTPAADAASRAGASATQKIVVRPVTATGHPAAGFTLTAGIGSVECSSVVPSPGAVSKDIEFCSPSYEAAVACWKAAAPNRVLCVRDPSTHTVVRISRTGGFAPTPLAPKKDRAPLLMVLANGSRCSIRDGGAWGTLSGHPQWNGTYSCTGGSAVWAPPGTHHYGINESTSSWTVHTASISGSQAVTVRHVRKAYFVGTAG